MDRYLLKFLFRYWTEKLLIAIATFGVGLIAASGAVTYVNHLNDELERVSLQRRLAENEREAAAIRVLVSRQAEKVICILRIRQLSITSPTNLRRSRGRCARKK